MSTALGLVILRVMISRAAILFFVLMFMQGCKKDPSIWVIDNLNGNTISVFGHGGMGDHYRYPMNSYQSLKDCLDLGANGTEMDVCVTRDSIVVLCHSQDLADNTGCDGLIKDKAWADIADCQFNLPIFSKADLIPALYFFDRVENKNKLTFTFDCKVTLEDNDAYLQLFADALFKHITKYNLVSNCFIESFNVSFLKMLQAKNKDLHLFLYTENYATGLAVSKTLNLYGLTLDNENISADEIKQAHQNQLRITLFNTGTEHENLEAIEKSPDFIQTDKVEYLLNALRE